MLFSGYVLSGHERNYGFVCVSWVLCTPFCTRNVWAAWVAGDEDGIWADLREAKMLIQAAVSTFTNHLSGNLNGPLSESLAYRKWGLRLIAILTSACQAALGDSAAGEFAILSLLLSPTCGPVHIHLVI
jgi:hypothetical protein